MQFCKFNFSLLALVVTLKPLKCLYNCGRLLDHIFTAKIRYIGIIKCYNIGIIIYIWCKSSTMKLSFIAFIKQLIWAIILLNKKSNLSLLNLSTYQHLCYFIRFFRFFTLRIPNRLYWDMSASQWSVSFPLHKPFFHLNCSLQHSNISWESQQL